LESQIANRENFVDEKNLGFEMRGNGESEAQLHPGAVALQRSVYELLDLGEGNNLVEFSSNFGSAHSQDSAAQEYIFSSGEIRVKSSADFEQAADPPDEFRMTRSGASDPGKNFQQCALTSPIPADKPYNFSLANLERNVSQSPYFLTLGTESVSTLPE
jgi:hypothetical protein